MRNRGGFTLLELMIVTVIIGVLASVAVASYAGLRERSKIAATRAELRNLLNAAETYRSITGLLPETLDILVNGGYHASSGNIDYCEFSRDPGPPEDLRIEAAHKGSNVHLVAQYPSAGVNMTEGVYGADCS